MSVKPKVLESTGLIRFQDCDPYRHLNNIKYLEYFINAREDQILKEYNLDIYQLAKDRLVGWVVGEHQISYISPALLMEKVVYQTRIIDFTDKTIKIECIMLDEHKKVLKCLLWSTLVHINLKTSFSEKHATDLTELFSSVVTSLEERHFSERIATLKALYKSK